MQGEYYPAPEVARLDALNLAERIASVVPVGNGETVASRTRNVMMRAAEIHTWLMTGEIPKGSA